MLSNGRKRRTIANRWKIVPSDMNDEDKDVGTIWVQQSDGDLYYTDTLGIAYNISTRTPTFDSVTIEGMIALKNSTTHPAPPPSGYVSQYSVTTPEYPNGRPFFQDSDGIIRHVTLGLGRAYTQFSDLTLTGTGTFEYESMIDDTESFGSLFRAANQTTAGTIGEFKAIGSIDMIVSNRDIQYGFFLGNTLIIESPIQALQQVTGGGNSYSIDIIFIVKEIGVAGVASIEAIGQFKYTKNNGVIESFTSFGVNNTTYDTTTDEIFDAKVRLEGNNNVFSPKISFFTRI
jgi:hypothetical protein